MAGLLSIGECMIEFAPIGTDGQFRQGFAGDTYNTAVYLARLQDRPVSYMTALGTDAMSDRMVARFREEGLGTEHVRRLPNRTPGLYIIETDGDGERRFQYWRNHSAARAMLGGHNANTLASVLSPFAAIYFSGITLAILDAHDRGVLLDALSLLRGDGDARTIAFDPNFRPILWDDPEDARIAVRRAAGLSDIALSTVDDNTALFGVHDAEQAARQWLGWGAGTAVIRDDAASSVIAVPGVETLRVSSHTITRPVDTTGGGDSYNAAYLSAALDRAIPQDAAGFGHMIAGEVVNGPGAIMDRERWNAMFPPPVMAGRL